MKKMRKLWALLCLILVIQSFAVSAFAEPSAENDPSVMSGCSTVDAQKPLDESGQLLGTAKAVILYELNSQTMVYAWNPDQQIYPSSMVKLMTALVAFEQGDLSEMVTVTRTALSAVEIGAVSAGLKAGETLTLEDLLYCMMVASANDASAVIAEHIAGSQENFVRLMNAKAEDMGCTGTNFTNAHGLHDDNNYTTARDVLRMTAALLEIPELKQMFNTVSYTVPATNLSDERNLVTTNYMMITSSKYYDQRVTGGKTGATDEAGRCLAQTMEDKGMNLLSIVMGAVPEYDEEGQSFIRFGHFEETQELLKYAFETYSMQQVFSQGQAIAQFPVESGANSVVVEPGDPVNTVLPILLEKEKLTWTYADRTGALTAPLEKGQKVSEVQVWYGSTCVAVTDLVAMHDVSSQMAPVDASRPTHQNYEGSWSLMMIVFAVLAAVAVIGVGVYMIPGFVRKIRLQARRRRRRSERRRNR